MKNRKEKVFFCLLVTTILATNFNSVTSNPIPIDDNYETSPFPDNYDGSVYFKQEIINVTFGEKATINAQYSFKNALSNETEIGILLPFAYHEYSTEPIIKNLTVGEEKLDYSWTTISIDLRALESSFSDYEDFSAISFILPFAANEEKIVHVQYSRDYEIYDFSEEIHYSFAYIVGTANAWNHSIEYAHFEFWIPKEICNGYNPPPYLEPMTVREERNYYVATLDYKDWTPSNPRLVILWSIHKPFFQNPAVFSLALMISPFFFIGILYTIFKKIKNRHYYSEK